MPLQSTLQTPDAGNGLCLLSFDAGGTEGISQLRVLVELMHNLNFDKEDSKKERPCTVFDLIGGVGSGGFIAILLVIFGLTAQDALDEFIEFTHMVLERTKLDAQGRTDALEVYIDGLMGRHNIDRDLGILDVNERSGDCKLAVLISYKQNVGAICIIRNFDTGCEPALEVTVSQAIFASLSTPPFFLPTRILKDSSVFDYVSADLILSNPILEIIAEAYAGFGGEEHVACLLSVGCGHLGILALPEASSLGAWNEFLLRLATEGHLRAQNVDAQIGDLGIYYRFSVMYGLEKVPASRHIDLEAILTFVIAAILWVYCQVLGTLPQEDKLVQKIGGILSHTAVYLAEPSLRRKVDLCVSLIRSREGITSLEQLRRSGGGKVLARAPPPLTRTFVMRTEPWSIMETLIPGNEPFMHVDGQRMLTITGGGGYGKSQLVLKFIQVHGEKFLSTFFIDGSSKDRIRADIIRNVRSLGIQHSQKLFEDCLIYLAQPSSNGPRLLVYDNVDDPKLDLRPLLPGGDTCTIIITSRNHSIGEMCRDAHLKLDVMSMEEAIELLLRGSSHLRPHTEQVHQAMVSISEALGCHPIALSQACSYMYQMRCSPSAYLKKLQNDPKRILEKPSLHQRDMRYPSASAAFDASFEAVPPIQRMCLQLLSCVHWDKFPVDLIHLAAETDFGSYEYQCIEPGPEFAYARNKLKEIFHRDGRWDSINLDETITSLQNYSLITLSSDGDVTLLEMHPLFHSWIHSSIPEQDRPSFQSSAALLLALGARREPTPPAQYLASHINHLHPYWETAELNDCWSFAYILSNSNQHDGALKLRERVVGELKKLLGEQDPVLQHTLEVLAGTYIQLGRFEDAMQLGELVLELRETTPGTPDDDSFAAGDSLAVTYRALGRLTEAEGQQAKVLARRREVLGAENPETLLASSTLATIHRDLGRLEEAENLQVEVLHWRVVKLGEYHPDTILAYFDLAVTLHARGSLVSAQNYFAKVVALRTEGLGQDHPETLFASTALGLTYRDLGQLFEAEMIQEGVLISARRVFGEGHSTTFAAYCELGFTYCAMGRFSDAERLMTDGLNLTKHVFGDSHPKTTSAVHKLIAIQIKALETRIGLQGEKHVDTILASASLAITYGNLGRHAEAEILQTEVLALHAEILGKDHPYTTLASSSLAITYCHLGKHAEAAVLLEGVLVQQKKYLGKNHPDTIQTSIDLAQIYYDIGKFARAEELQAGVVNLTVERRGTDHPETTRALEDLEAIQVKILQSRIDTESSNASTDLAGSYAALLSPSGRVGGREGRTFRPRRAKAAGTSTE